MRVRVCVYVGQVCVCASVCLCVYQARVYVSGAHVCVCVRACQARVYVLHVCVFVHVCMCQARVRVCVRASGECVCVSGGHVCVRACVRVHVYTCSVCTMMKMLSTPTASTRKGMTSMTMSVSGTPA